MTDLRTLIFGKGSETALAVEKAKAGVDEAKAGIEEAKLRLEEAKAHLADANAAFDLVLAEMEEAGLPKAKARKAIEEINQTLVSIGAISEDEAMGAVSAATTEKPSRRKRKDKPETEDGSDANVVVTPTAESVVESNSVTEAASVTNEVSVVEAPLSEVVENPAAVQPIADSAASVTEEVVEPSVIVAEKTDANSSVDQSEILDLINEATVDIEADKKTEVLGILTNALDLASNVATNEGGDLDLDFFRDFLGGMANDPEEASFVVSVYRAFIDVISAVEAQTADVKLVLPSENVQIEETVVAVVEDVALVSIDIGEAATEETLEPTVTSSDDVTNAPDFLEETAVAADEEADDQLDHYAATDESTEYYDDYVMEPGESDISDDETFPITGEEESDEAVSVVENINDMNFLEEEPAASTETSAKDEAPAAETPVDEKKAEEPVRKPFAAPSFMRPKS